MAKVSIEVQSVGALLEDVAAAHLSQANPSAFLKRIAVGVQKATIHPEDAGHMAALVEELEMMRARWEAAEKTWTYSDTIPAATA